MNEVNIDGYSLSRHDRNKHGGGVCLNVKNNISFRQINDVTTQNWEALWIELLLPRTRPIRVGVCYRPPHDNTFLDKLENALITLDPDRESILLEDMNICYNKENT